MDEEDQFYPEAFMEESEYGMVDEYPKFLELLRCFFFKALDLLFLAIAAYMLYRYFLTPIGKC